MKTSIFNLARTAFISLSLMLAAASTLCAQTSGAAAVLSADAQAQALLQKLSAHPTVPLTPAESQILAQYFAAKNPQSVASSMPVTSAAQLLGQTSPRVIVNGAPSASNSAAIQSTGSSAALASKSAGSVRIGVASPKVDLGQGFQGPSAGESMRSLLSQYLNGPKFEVVSLSALVPQQIDSEAKEKQCEYVVYSSVVMKKAGGFGLLKAATSVASMMPMGAAIGAAGAVAGAAASTAAVGLSSQVKAKSEVTLDYHVFAPGNTTAVLENKSSAKAKTDGEDVVTPLVEAAATSIVAKLTPKN
jgi:hypothetical protein